MKSFKSEFLTEEINYKNLVRSIPTGSKVITKLSDKSLNIKIVSNISAPPLVTDDVGRIGTRIVNEVDSFIKDIKKEIKIKSIDKDKYVFLKGIVNAIQTSYEFTVYVGSVAEGKKLAKLDEALEFSKNYKL